VPTEDKDADLEAILEEYDAEGERVTGVQEERRLAAEAFRQRFQVVASDIIRPYFKSVAKQLEEHGHKAYVVDESSEAGDGNPKVITGIMLRVSAKGADGASPRPQIIVRCDADKERAQTFEGPRGTASQGVSWQLDEITEQALRERTVSVIKEALTTIRGSRNW
jgi:hypothetical protein